MRKLVDLNTEVGRIVLISGKRVARIYSEDILMILVSGEHILNVNFSDKDILMVLMIVFISGENIPMALMQLRIYFYSWSSFLERISS